MDQLGNTGPQKYSSHWPVAKKVDKKSPSKAEIRNINW